MIVKGSVFLHTPESAMVERKQDCGRRQRIGRVLNKLGMALGLLERNLVSLKDRMAGVLAKGEHDSGIDDGKKGFEEVLNTDTKPLPMDRSLKAALLQAQYRVCEEENLLMAFLWSFNMIPDLGEQRPKVLVCGIACWLISSFPFEKIRRVAPILAHHHHAAV